MVMSLEDTCGVEIPTEDLETMVTVGDVAEYLEQHKTKKDREAGGSDS